MKVYFDNCAIQRSLDDRSNYRNRIEAEAIIVLIEMAEQGELFMVSSDVLLFELKNTPDLDRIAYGMKFLDLSKETFSLTKEIVDLARRFENNGIKSIDALHLAIADFNHIDYLCTCDDRFLKKAAEIKHNNTRVILPTKLIEEIL